MPYLYTIPYCQNYSNIIDTPRTPLTTCSLLLLALSLLPASLPRVSLTSLLPSSKHQPIRWPNVIFLLTVTRQIDSSNRSRVHHHYLLRLYHPDSNHDKIV